MSLNQKYDVIVIGAGVSGLAAAHALVKQNLSVLVLEARDRLGGRISTDHAFGVPIDLGASFVHDVAHNSILRQEAQLGLEVVPLSTTFDNIHDYLMFDEGGKPLSSEFLTRIAQWMSHFFQELMLQNADANPEGVLKNHVHPALTSHENQLARDWLRKSMTGWAGADLAQTSIQLWQAQQEEVGNAYVRNGYETLIKKLSEGVTVLCDHPVSKIDYTQSVVLVTAGQKIFQANRVIVTLPLGVLKANTCIFNPPLPSEKQKAIETIGYGLLNKAVLNFPTCFWDNTKTGIQFFANYPIKFYHALPIVPKKPILVAFYGGDFAWQMESLSEKEQRRVFKEPDPMSSTDTWW